ncbi:MAG TPA: hypothetical protein VEQ60_28845 [Longimicrobium sp.]|nr:hypothetical protein [Longimicrobium sp.]
MSPPPHGRGFRGTAAAFLPGLLLVLTPLLVTSLGAWVGGRFGQAPQPLHPAALLAPAPDSSQAARLRTQAQALELRAEQEELRPLPATATTDTLEARSKLAAAYRDLAGVLASRASAFHAAHATRDARRNLWVYSVWLDLAVCGAAGLVALGFLCAVLLRLRRTGCVTRRLCAVTAAGAVVLTVAAAVAFAGVWHDYDTAAFRLAALALGSDVMRMVRFDDALHIATVAMAVSAGAVVFAAPGLTPAGVLDSEADIALHMHYTRLELYVGAAILVAYVAMVSTLFHWVRAFVPATDPVLMQGVDAIAQSAVTSRSLLASSLLVGVYVPCMLLLRVRALELAARRKPGATTAEREEWMKAQGLHSTGPVESLKPVLAIVAPVLTGPVAELLQRFLA